MILFLFLYILSYILIILAMCLDNVNWIKSSPEYEDFKNNKFPLTNRDGTFKSKFDYVFRGRILAVIKDWRDIKPALISSLFSAIVLRIVLLSHGI